MILPERRGPDAPRRRFASEASDTGTTRCPNLTVFALHDDVLRRTEICPRPLTRSRTSQRRFTTLRPRRSGRLPASLRRESARAAWSSPGGWKRCEIALLPSAQKQAPAKSAADEPARGRDPEPRWEARSNGLGILLARAASTQAADLVHTYHARLPVREGAKSTAVGEAVWSETSPLGNPRSSNSLLERAPADQRHERARRQDANRRVLRH